MSKRGWITICVLALIFVASGAISYFYGPQISYQLKFLRLGSNYKFDTPTGKVTQAKSVAIAGCRAEPVFAFTFVGSTIRFVNADDRPHVLFMRKAQFTVPANGYYDAKIDFLKSSGEKISYDCDSSKNIGIVGIFKSSGGATTTSAQ